MPKITIRTISIVIALLSGAITGVSLFLLISYNVSWLSMAITTVAVVGFVYLLTFNILLRVVIEQITPIYKTIYSLDISKKSLRDKLINNPIETAKEEVAKWAEKKTQEISSLYELEQFRREFVGNVSHELKTPIFNIQGYVLTLLDGAISDPEISQKYLDRTEKSVNRLIAIVEDLDIISRLESKKMSVKIETFNIVKLVDETLESLEMEAKKRNIKLKRKTGADDVVMVEADRQRISQVLTNLVVNSINYGNEGGTTLISFSSMPERILVEVKDNGVGIESKDIPRIFERFYRVDKHRSREHGGSGLGLAIVKHIIEAHEQTINVRSGLGKGSTFAFTLKKAANPIRTLFSLNNAPRD